jgi:hypothetical protein
MQIGNLTVSNFTVMLAVLWCLVALLNGKSLVMLATLITYTAIQAVTTTNFHAFLICSTLYFYFAQSNIKILSSFRQAFMLFGVVYFLGSIDQAIYYHFDLDTRFDRIQPYLITAINAYALAILLNGGGKQDAGLVNNIGFAFNRWRFWLS